MTLMHFRKEILDISKVFCESIKGMLMFAECMYGNDDKKLGRYGWLSKAEQATNIISKKK